MVDGLSIKNAFSTAHGVWITYLNMIELIVFDRSFVDAGLSVVTLEKTDGIRISSVNFYY